MCSYRQFLLWQQALRMACLLHQWTQQAGTPGQEQLAGRLRETALEIPVSLALDYSPEGTRLPRGLRRAHQGLVRLEHLVHLAGQLHYWPPSVTRCATRQLAEVRLQLRALRRSLGQ